MMPLKSQVLVKSHKSKERNTQPPPPPSSPSSYQLLFLPLLLLPPQIKAQRDGIYVGEQDGLMINLMS